MSTTNAGPGAAKGASARLRGGWLAVARIVWVPISATTLGLFALSVPPGYALLRTVCTESPCGPEQLTLEGARVVERVGLSLWLRESGGASRMEGAR